MSFSKLNAIVLAAAALIAPSTAHLIMKDPVPFGVDSLNNSPLVNAKPGSASSDFPCKQRAGVYDITEMNNMKVGDSQLLDFTGSASHGGGTCQIAVSMDPEPSANATWKLIQVFEGGCPIDANGNAGTHPFTFTIPENFPNGRATLAWTWYNRIGNREIYMNCAPITVTGGSNSHDYYDTLPDMYVINLPTSECSSVETTNQKIPFPGQFIMNGETTSIVAASGPSCSASAAAQTQGVTGYQSAIKANGAALQAPATDGDVTAMPTGTAAASNAYTAPVASQAQTTAEPSATGGLLTISTAASSAPAASTPAPTPVATHSSDPSNAVPSGTTPSNGGGGNTTSTSGNTCTNEGAVVCNGPTLFGLCNHGSVVFMSVADGTECTNGQVVKKRSLHVQHKRNVHMRRHARHLAAGVLDS